MGLDKLLMNRRPDLYAELHPTMNNTIDITKLTGSSGKKVWWQCSKNEIHYWPATVNDRFNGHGCSMCSSRYIVHGVNDLSVLNPSLYDELHPTMNTIDTTKLSLNSHKKVWWKCQKNPLHDWQATVSSRNGRKTGCGRCSNRQVSSEPNYLSVSNPDLYAELHSTKNTIDITNLLARSNEKVWWKCQKNETHYWPAKISSRVQGNGCAMCHGSFIEHGVNDLSALKPNLYVELHPTLNTIDTTKLSPGSKKKVWWKCPKEPSHEWQAVVYGRSRGRGCPDCITYSNETEFRSLFTDLTNIEFKDGHVLGKRELFKSDKIQIDMINYEHNIAIEYDGYFSHGGNILYKKTLEDTLAKDIDTTTTLLNDGYKVVRIRETPLQFLELQHENLFQVAFKDRDDKLPAIRMIVEALQAMGVGIKFREI